MISKEEFYKRAEELISTEDIKNYTNKMKRYDIALIVALISIAVLAVICIIFLPIFFVIICVFPAIIVLGVVLSLQNSLFNKFNNKYSDKVFAILLKDYKYEYNRKQYIHEKYFLDSGFAGVNTLYYDAKRALNGGTVFNTNRLMGNYDSYTGEDYLRLNIPNDDNTPSDIYLNICDLHITRTERDSDGRSHTVTVYSGVFGYIHFPFEFKCDLALNSGRFKGKKRIKLEDINFNKTFATYTNNHIEALVILTPTLMNKLMAFRKKVGNLKIFLKQNGYMYIGINKNLFRLKKIKKPSPQIFENYYDDVASILALVDEIKNNNKVFKF